MQQEGANEIQEALEVLKQWDPSWQPKFFMSDYSEAELGAISNSFPTATTCAISTENSAGSGG